MARTPPSRLSRARILRELGAAARKGDRTALTLAVAEMRTLALSPRYWERYLALLRSPLARLVDLLVIKQGDRIASQKGWTGRGGRLRRASSSAAPAARSDRGLRGSGRRAERQPGRRRRRPGGAAEQIALFEP